LEGLPLPRTIETIVQEQKVAQTLTAEELSEENKRRLGIAENFAPMMRDPDQSFLTRGTG
jgi:hypothetical protein